MRRKLVPRVRTRRHRSHREFYPDRGARGRRSGRKNQGHRRWSRRRALEPRAPGDSAAPKGLKPTQPCAAGSPALSRCSHSASEWERVAIGRPASAACPLGRIKRLVSVRQKHCRIDPVTRVGRKSHAAAWQNGSATKMQRASDLIQNTLCQARHAVTVSTSGHEQGKFITAETRHEIVLPAG